MVEWASHLICTKIFELEEKIWVRTLEFARVSCVYHINALFDNMVFHFQELLLYRKMRWGRANESNPICLCLGEENEREHCLRMLLFESVVYSSAQRVLIEWKSNIRRTPQHCMNVFGNKYCTDRRQSSEDKMGSGGVRNEHKNMPKKRRRKKT